MANRDIEKSLSREAFVNKLKRLVEILENDKKLEIQIAGEKVSVPVSAEYSIEHERDGEKEEIEFQIKWER